MTEWKVYRYVTKQSDDVKLLSGPIKRQIDYGHHADVLLAWPLTRRRRLGRLGLVSRRVSPRVLLCRNDFDAMSSVLDML